MRVAIVAPFPTRKFYAERCQFQKAGTEHPASWIVNLTWALAERSEIELHLLTVKSHLAHDCRFFDRGVNFHVLRGTWNTLQPFMLYELDRQTLVKELRSIRPDVIESFGTEGPFSYAGVTSGYPCVIKMQGIITRIFREMRVSPISLTWWRYLITQFVEQYTIRHGTDFIVDNDYLAGFVRSFNDSGRIHLIPNLIASIFFEINQDWSRARFNLLFVGALKREKGVFDLLEAFRRVHADFPLIRLKLIGSASADVQSEIESFVSTAGLENAVRLTGNMTHNQIAEELKQAVCLVHPSWADSSPNTVYEAMIAGLPVIATRVGGLPYMIDAGQTGVLIAPHNPADLAEALITLLTDRPTQERLGRNAQAVMRQRFDKRRVVDDILQVYRRLAA